MKSLVRSFALLALATVGLLAGGCAAPANDGTQYLTGTEKPSNLPWNAPQKWEGQGALGGLNNLSGGGGGGVFGNR